MSNRIGSFLLAFALCAFPTAAMRAGGPADPKPSNASPAPPATGATQAKGPATVRRLEASPTYKIMGGKGSATILYDAAAGSPNAAMTVLTIEPGGLVATHVHETSDEYLFVLEGESELTVGSDKVTVVPGDAVHIPMNTQHGAKVTGGKPFKVVQIYTPAGPEQRFVSRPDAPKP